MTVIVDDQTRNTDRNVYGGEMDPAGIVLHGTGSTNEASDQWWLSHWHEDPVSIHQLVKRNGTIVQIVPMNRQAWHAGESILNGRRDCNSFCIGVELCNSNKGERFTDAQYEALAQTVAYNTALFRIPDNWVATHAQVALPRGRKDDPVDLDMERVWKRVWQLRAEWPFVIKRWACSEK